SIEGRAILFDRDGSRFYACALRDAGAWDPQGRRQQWKYVTDGRLIEHLAVHPTDGSVVLSELDRSTFTHISATGEPLRPFGTNSASSLEFSRGGRLLLTVDGAHSRGNPGRAFSVLEYPTGTVLRMIPFDQPHQPYAAFCLDDAAVATAARGGGITVWDWKAGTPL